MLLLIIAIAVGVMSIILFVVYFVRKQTFVFDGAACIAAPCKSDDNCFGTLQECADKVQFCCTDGKTCAASVNCSGKTFKTLSDCSCSAVCSNPTYIWNGTDCTQSCDCSTGCVTYQDCLQNNCCVKCAAGGTPEDCVGSSACENICDTKCTNPTYVKNNSVCTIVGCDCTSNCITYDDCMGTSSGKFYCPDCKSTGTTGTGTEYNSQDKCKIGCCEDVKYYWDGGSCTKVCGCGTLNPCYDTYLACSSAHSASTTRTSYDNFTDLCIENKDYVPKRQKSGETPKPPVFSGNDNMFTTGKCADAPRIKSGAIPTLTGLTTNLSLKAPAQNASKSLPFDTTGLDILSYDHEENLTLLNGGILQVTYGDTDEKFGAQFWWNIPGIDEGILTYSIRFPNNFVPAYGGKLPGIFGFNSQGGNVAFNNKTLSHCTGSNNSNGINCWSIRPMWRHGMIGEALAVVPVSSNSGKLYNDDNNKVKTSCTNSYGCDLSRGSFVWPACTYNGDTCTPTNVWYKIKQYVKLNTIGVSDGVYMLSITGPAAGDSEQVVIHITGIYFRSTDELKFNGLVFSTFYGGGSSKLYGPGQTVNIDFKDFSMQAAA